MYNTYKNFFDNYMKINTVLVTGGLVIVISNLIDFLRNKYKKYYQPN